LLLRGIVLTSRELLVRNFLKLLLGAVGCCGATGAIAADMGLPPPPAPFVAPAPPPLWTGFYVGAHGGGAWDPTGGNNTNCGNACTFAQTTLAGVAGGLQLGYNYQFGMMVLGAEADFSGSSLRGSYPALDGIDTLTTSVDYFGTVTGKVGVAVGRLLIYGKGGAAWVHTNNSDFDTIENLSFTANYWQMGWTVGGGAEYALSPNWSVKLEYSAIQTPNKSTTFTSTPPFFFTALMHQQINLVTAGVNYRF
jgi:outer membrane immunogenic protein